VLRIPSIVDGKEIDAPDCMAVLDPSTGEAWGEAGRCSDREVGLAVQAARRAYDGTWADTPAAERGRLLRRLAECVRRDGERLAWLETRDVGMPIRQARDDVTAVARCFDHYGSVAEALHGDTLQTAPSLPACTVREPYGVTAHVTPGNHPLQMTARTVAPSLAAGNCCVHKPAEDTPVTAVEIARLALEAGFPPGAYNVVNGPGATTGDALTRHPGVDHISFTGSRPVGGLVAANAAANVVPCVLELGGKSPDIVFPDADLDLAVPLIVNAIIQNAGPTCSAGSRLLVHRDVYDEVVGEVAATLGALVPGRGLDDPDLGPLISARRLGTVSGLVAAAVAAGEGEVLAGGGRPDDPALNGGYFFRPTLVGNVDERAVLFREDVFGPVAIATPFADEADAVRLAGAAGSGPVAAVWTRDVGRAHRVARKVRAGHVFVNTCGAGGVRGKGFEGMLGYTQTKTVAVGL
jgi:aldehyde dehydrogenase (NAD+)